MAIRSRLYPSDEELGKRDDDAKSKAHSNGWLPKSSKAPLLRRRRILGLVAACLCVWLLVRNLSSSTLEGRPSLRRHGAARARPEQRDALDNGEDLWRQAQMAQDDNVPESTGTSQDKDAGGNAQDFNGPIRFYYLASSLHAAAKVSGQRASNENILFTAADLKSAADLIPLACEMARWKRNNVHVALMGRDAVPLDEVKKMNSVENESLCPVFWHDARPDFARKSTNHRMEVSVAGAMGHIENFMHPQAVITSFPYYEDDFFVRAIARKTKELDQTHIELPEQASGSMSWMARLSAHALHSWHAATIDIVVQAPQDTSANIVRLLKSLEEADYGAFLPPRLTVELPHNLHHDTMAFLDGFEWPPTKYQKHLPYHELVLHRRIPDKRLTDYESSTRFMESFYPYDTMDSHVLVLSPQAQLSPTFFHYLKYHLLEYRYSDASDDLFGISLETPSSFLNGSEGFMPPKPDEDSSESKEHSLTPFLWQAPNTGAALIFADKWIEFHSFLTQMMTASNHPKTNSFFESREKQVSEKLPSWVEYLLDLMMARGYYFMYPGIVSGTTSASSLAIIHDDMYQIPEEFLRGKRKEDANPDELPEGDVLEGSDTAYLSNHHAPSEEDSTAKEKPLLRNLLAALPPDPPAVSKPGQSDEDVPKPVPALGSLPLLDDQGLPVSLEALSERTVDAAARYRQLAGGCAETSSRDVSVVHGNAEDLFCVSGHSEPSQQPSKKQKSKNSHPEEKSEPAQQVTATEDVEAKALEPTTTKQHFKATGAAAGVNAAVDPDSYAATAVAGFKEKKKTNKKYDDDIPTIDIDDHALTNEERRELNSLNARMRNLHEAEAESKLQSHPNVDKEAGKEVGRDSQVKADETQKAPTERKSSRSRTDDEKDASKAGRLEPVPDEREYERTDEYAPDLPQPQETVAERPTEAGTRPENTDEPLSKGRTSSDGDNERGAGSAQADAKQKGKSNLPDEAQDSAIGGRGGKAFKKGRIGGWDVGGYDEGILDEKAAAAGRLDFARNRYRKKDGPSKEVDENGPSERTVKQLKVQKEIGPDEPDEHGQKSKPD
ncbi:MAG: hypothetical protein Q9162_000300 [Coniocarpon cinnabarinum]